MKLFIFTFLFLSLIAFSQKGEKLQVTPLGEDNTFLDIAQSVVGEGVLLQSATSNQSGDSKMIGSFRDPKRALGMKNGVVLSTGSVEYIKGENTMTGMTAFKNGQLLMDHGGHYLNKSYFAGKGDADLETTIQGGKTFDACVMELDIIPLGDQLEFTYVFASEEYDEYVGTAFNDAFAFYMSGEGLSGKQNLALLGKTNIPVTINNVNDGNPGLPNLKSMNSSFYKRNTNQVYIQFDGMTKVMKVSVKVVPNKVYHLKMVIADVGDNALDSGVFIEHKSIRSYNEVNDVYFDSNQSELTTSSKLILDYLIDNLDEQDEQIILSGHTDDVGNQDDNYDLSNDRVNSVKKYLMSSGIDESLIMCEVYGEDKPIANNDLSVGRKDNRRVEIKKVPSMEVYDNIKEKREQDFQLITELNDSQIFQNSPNPVKEMTTIPVYVNSDKAKVIIQDVTGYLIQELAIVGQGSQALKLNVTNYKTGVYFASLVVDDEQLNSIKIMVTK